MTCKFPDFVYNTMKVCLGFAHNPAFGLKLKIRGDSPESMRYSYEKE